MHLLIPKLLYVALQFLLSQILKKEFALCTCVIAYASRLLNKAEQNYPTMSLLAKFSLLFGPYVIFANSSSGTRYTYIQITTLSRKYSRVITSLVNSLVGR